ncbi:MAG: GNAT family N-acetyltransferase [Treponema sp.]|nr:GNAT family N-acetyltransferase [Treponema sp.]MCL2237951.1 GNAT family N-acetyltransferase [Treponema sp.]
MAFDEYLQPLAADNYTVRLCENENELKEYKDLRYKHLILEFDPEKAKTAKDGDTDENIGYDKNTVQLCAFHNDPETGKTEIVGGYIMMRFKNDDDLCKITQKYDMSLLFKKHKFEIVEISRAVVRPDHRNGLVTKLLWDRIAAYTHVNNCRYILGTMSFSGLDPLKYTEAASYLHHNYRMPEDIMVRPIESCAYYHDYIKKEDVNRKAAVSQFPPLLKGLLMIGAKTGDGFYIDKDLGVVETFAILDTHFKKHDLSNFGNKKVIS